MFRKKTVASVMSVFTKTVEDLNEIRSVNLLDAIGIGERIDELRNKKEEHEAEASLADVRAQAIQKMLDG